jgi:hypothetical protein
MGLISAGCTYKRRVTMKTVIAVLAAVLMLLGTAVAQAPPNDDITAATVIPAVPFTDAINTTEATTAADDPDCVGQGPTVWYSFTPDADGTFGANTFGSDYDTTLSVYTGTPGNLTQIACNDDFTSLQSAVIFNAVAGETYFLMVGAFASGPWGSLSFRLEETEPIVIDLALSPKGAVVPKTGTATVRGTVVCNEPATVFGIGGELKQRKGRVFLRGFFGVGEFACEPPETEWSAIVTAENGLFTGGKATVLNVSASGCGEFSCDDVFIEGPVEIQLTGKGKK